MSSRQYMANMFGMSNGDPKKKKKDQEVSMECSKDGCSAYNAGGGKSNTGMSKSVAVKKPSSSKGEANKVLSKKQADKRADQFAKNRAKSAATNKSKF